MSLFLQRLGALALIAPMALAAGAQTPAPKAEAPGPKSGETELVDPPIKTENKRPSKSSPEDRWKGMSEDERRVLLERFEELRRLSPEDREALHKRAAELADQRKNLESKLDPRMRRDLDDLPPHERSRILREHQVAEHRRAGERLRESLEEGPRELVEELVRQRPGPPRPFHELRDELRGTFGDKAVKRFGELGHLTPEQQQHLLTLSGPERMHEALLIKRGRIEAGVDRAGLPKEVSEKQWKKMQEEPSVERFLKHARKRGFDQHLGLGRFDCPPKPSGARDGKGGKGGKGPGQPPRGPGGAPGPRGPGPDPAAERPGFRELADVLRPTLEDRLATSELSERDRHKDMAKRLKKRAAAYLAEHEVLSEDERKALNGMKAEAYMDYLLELVHERRGLGPPERRDRGKWDKGRREPSDRGQKDRGQPDRGPRR